MKTNLGRQPTENDVKPLSLTVLGLAPDAAETLTGVLAGVGVAGQPELTSNPPFCSVFFTG